MLPRRPAVYRFARPPVAPRCHPPHFHSPVRRYAVSSAPEADVDAEPAWFQPLRAEMLAREPTYFHEKIVAEPENRLVNTLAGFLPPSWCRPATGDSPVITPGHHLIWFNPALPFDRLLPDGTDVLHSPGPPWARRMWAGGSVVTRPDQYFNHKEGFVLGAAMTGVECIKDVRLRGHGNTAKLFVTIERRFFRTEHLLAAKKKKSPGGSHDTRQKVATYFKKLLQDTSWGDSILAEERVLVFFQEEPSAEPDASEDRHMAPIKYLDSAGNPEVSHMLTPTPELLFRFSALTFNAHRIHLDRDYARRVEGHRNLLVHGPLSLALMMQFMSKHVKAGDTGPEVIHRFDYRNLAPLYCDEPMRICASKKYQGPDATCDAYHVWIEGPTGGIAVKGTVHTAMVPRKVRKFKVKKSTQTAEIRKDRLHAQETHQAQSETSAAKEAQSCPSQESVEAGPFRRTRKRDYPFFDPVPLIRCVKISRPLVRRLRSQDRLTYERRKKKYVKATPPVPTFGATRYKPRTFALASKRNIFRKRGVRRIHNLVFRRVGQRLVAPRDKGRILW